MASIGPSPQSSKFPELTCIICGHQSTLYRNIKQHFFCIPDDGTKERWKEAVYNQFFIFPNEQRTLKTPNLKAFKRELFPEIELSERSASEDSMQEDAPSLARSNPSDQELPPLEPPPLIERYHLGRQEPQSVPPSPALPQELKDQPERLAAIERVRTRVFKDHRSDRNLSQAIPPHLPLPREFSPEVGSNDPIQVDPDGEIPGQIKSPQASRSPSNARIIHPESTHEFKAFVPAVQQTATVSECSCNIS